MKSPIKLRAGLIGLALAFYLLIQVLAQFPNFVEDYYSNGLYPLIALVVSNVSGLFPFSLSEAAFWSILLFGIPFVIRRIRRKRMKFDRIFLNLLTTLSTFYVWFHLFWGINYLRPPLRTKLQLDAVQLEIDAFDSTFANIIRRANDLNLGYSIQDIRHINSLIDSSYNVVLQEFGLKPIPHHIGAKSFAFNWLLNATTTSGWFSPFFHEIHFNSDLLIFELPFVLAHEKAHQLGYTNEADANFLAHLVCVNTHEPLIQYSGYFQVLGYFLGDVRKYPDKNKHYLALLKEGVKLDLRAVQERWQSHAGLVSKASYKFYDLYLKANDVKEGIASYSWVVGLIVRYYQKEKSIAGTRHSEKIFLKSTDESRSSQ
ncbi:MAG TPA: DUF3810 domain-containing protein [bacterium]